MAQNTKGDIIACARRLFEAEGYNGVSMRDIAGELEISVGNLTYHFKKKEDLIEAILLDSQAARHRPSAARSLEELREYILHILSVQQTYAFYFDSYHQLAQTSSVLFRVQQDMLAEITSFLEESFTNLQTGGMLSAEGYPGQHGAAIRTMTVLLMVRLPGEERRTAGERGTQTVLEGLRGVLYPLLTEEGREALPA